jgi:O-antigen/teichoic acid export membrane protein
MTSLESIKSRALIGTGWSSLSTGLTRVISWIVTLIFARLFDPESYGLIAITWVCYGAAVLTRDQAVSGMVVYGPDEEVVRRRATTIALVGSLLLGVGLVAVAPALTMWTGVESQPLTVGMAVALVISSFGVTPSGLLQKRLRFAGIAASELLASIVFAVSAIAMSAAGIGVAAIGIAQVIGAVLGVVAVVIASRYFPMTTLDWQTKYGIAIYGASVFALSFATFAFMNIDTFAVASVLGGEDLGRYSLAFNIACVGAIGLSSVLNRVAFPTYSLAREHESSKSVYTDSLKLIAAVGIPVAALTAFVGPLLIEPLFGAEYSGMDSAIAILSIYGLSLLYSSTATALEKAMGTPGKATRIVILQIVLSVPLLVWLTPSFGVVGAATSVTLPIAIGSVALVARTAKAMDVSLRTVIATIQVPALSAIPLLAAIAIGRTLGGLLPTLLASAAGLSVYVIVALHLSPEVGRRLKKSRTADGGPAIDVSGDSRPGRNESDK